MPASHRKFGDLLEEGIKRVHITQKKPIGYILDEFGYELRPEDSSKGRYALGHWYYKKRIPADVQDVGKLAELIVTKSDVDRGWLKVFLDSAGYPESDKLCDRYFMPEPKKAEITDQPSSIHVDAPHDSLELVEHDSQPVRPVHSWIRYVFGILTVLGIVALILRSQRNIMAPVIDANPTATNVLQSVFPTANMLADLTPTISVEAPTGQPTTPTADFASFDGKCPTVSSTSAFEYTSPQSFRDFLNAGGSFTALQSGFNALVQGKSVIRDGRVSNVDLTGDGVPEIIISAIFEKGSVWQILECNLEKYDALVDIEDLDFRYLRFAVDLNGDRLPEIIGYRQTEPESTPLYEFFIQGWNGHQIVDMSDNTRFDEIGGRLPADIFDWQRTIANATVTTRDVNGDGLYEVVVTGGLITPVPTCETRFERQFSEVWAWNGRSFQIAERVYVPPIYRFQRSADGDLAFALQQSDIALKAYQDVLFDVNLFRRDQYLPHLEYCKGIGPATELIENEPDLLEAYARWRILLINAVAGSQDAMQVVYQTLQEKFPDGKPGHSYAVIASAFWEEYQKFQNIETACELANATAGEQELYPSHKAENMCFIP